MTTVFPGLIVRPCKSCLQDGQPDRMMHCHGCKEWFHAACLGPEERLFTGKWVCATCVASAELPVSESTTIASTIVPISSTATSAEASTGSILTEKAKADLLWIADQREFILREVEKQRLELDLKKEEMDRLGREAAQVIIMSQQAPAGTSDQQYSANSSDDLVQRIMEELKNITIGTPGLTAHDTQAPGHTHNSTPMSTSAPNLGILPSNVGTFTVLNRPTVPSTGYSYNPGFFTSLPEHQQQPQQSGWETHQAWPQPQQTWPQPQQGGSGSQQGARQQVLPQPQQGLPQSQQALPQLQQVLPQPQQVPLQPQQVLPQPQQVLPQPQQGLPQSQQALPQLQQVLPQPQQVPLQPQQVLPQPQQVLPQPQQVLPQPQQVLPQPQQVLPQPQQVLPQLQQGAPQQAWPQPQQGVPQPLQAPQGWPQPPQAWPQATQAWPQPIQAWPQPTLAWPQPAQAWPQPPQIWQQQLQDYPQNGWTQQGQQPHMVPGCITSPTPQQLLARQIMPKDLPKFYGNPEDWPLFFAAFTNSTDACGYSNVENMARLRHAVLGKALDQVRGKLLYPTLVPQVISTLYMLYGRPELIIQTLLDKVRETPSPKAEKLETLITFGIAVQNMCDHIVAAGHVAHLCNPVLLRELVEKLPAQQRLNWALFKQQFPVVDLSTFAAYMTKLVEAASEVTVITDSKQPRAGRTERSGEKNYLNVHSTSDSSTRDDHPKEEAPKKETTCLSCNSTNHKLKNCETFQRWEPNLRWKLVQDNHLCRTCLGKHGRRPCNLRSRCGVDGCQERHNELLHRETPTYQTLSQEGHDQPGETKTAGGGFNAHHATKKSTLFRILPVTLTWNEKSVNTYAFLDDGSDLTLVEQSIAEHLGIDDGEPTPLCLSWTSSVTRQEPKSQRVRLEISGEGKKERFTLNDTRTVVSLDLPKQTMRFHDLSRKFTYLRGRDARCQDLSVFHRLLK